MPVASAEDIVVDNSDTAAGMPMRVATRLAVAHEVDLVFVVELKTGAD